MLDEVHNFHTTTNGFGLNKAGDEVFLINLPADSAGYIADSVAFKGQENGASWGRYPDGASNWIPLAPRTPGAANSQRMPAPLITELMFNPLFGSAVFTNSTPFQFVEIWNPLSSAVQLFNTNGVFRLDGGLSFYFPAGVVLQPKQTLLVANLDANNPAQLAEFRRVYSLGTNVSVFGPFSGKLGSRGDRVALERPQAPDLPGSGIS